MDEKLKAYKEKWYNAEGFKWCSSGEHWCCPAEFSNVRTYPDKKGQVCNPCKKRAANEKHRQLKAGQARRYAESQLPALDYVQTTPVQEIRENDATSLLLSATLKRLADRVEKNSLSDTHLIAILKVLAPAVEEKRESNTTVNVNVVELVDRIRGKK